MLKKIKKRKNIVGKQRGKALEEMPTILETSGCGDVVRARDLEARQRGELGGSDGAAEVTDRMPVAMGQIRLITHYPTARINSVQTKGWEEVDLVVDSGASETVIGPDMIRSAALYTGNMAKRGVEYEVADGSRIQNQGEKKFLGITEEESAVSITAQVCDVNKGLLSVGRMVELGQRVVFDKSGSYIQDCKTGEKMWMVEERGLYVLKLWVETPSNRSF